MKRIISLTFFTIVLLALIGCTFPEEISRDPIDIRYTPAFSGVETTYTHKYSFLDDGFKLVPDVKTVYHAEKWEVQYLITYDNGGTEKIWREVSRFVYAEAEELLQNGGDIE